MVVILLNLPGATHDSLGAPEQSSSVTIEGIDPIVEERKPFAELLVSYIVYMPMGSFNIRIGRLVRRADGMTRA